MENQARTKRGSEMALATICHWINLVSNDAPQFLLEQVVLKERDQSWVASKLTDSKRSKNWWNQKFYPSLTALCKKSVRKVERGLFSWNESNFSFSDPSGVCPSVGNGGPSAALGPTVGLNSNGKPNQTVTSTVLTAKDNFMRRSSRTSFTEIEVSLLNHMSRHNFSDLNLGGRRREPATYQISLTLRWTSPVAEEVHYFATNSR